MDCELLAKLGSDADIALLTSLSCGRWVESCNTRKTGVSMGGVLLALVTSAIARFPTRFHATVVVGGFGTIFPAQWLEYKASCWMPWKAIMQTSEVFWTFVGCAHLHLLATPWESSNVFYTVQSVCYTVGASFAGAWLGPTCEFLLFCAEDVFICHITSRLTALAWCLQLLPAIESSCWPRRPKPRCLMIFTLVPQAGPFLPSTGANCLRVHLCEHCVTY